MLRISRNPTTHSRRLSLSVITGLVGTVCLLLTIAASASAQTPALSVGDVISNEADTGTQPLVGFEVTLSAPSQQTVSVLFSTQSGTAIGDQDFASGSLTVTFAPNQTTQIVSVAVRGDNIVEGTEQFFVNLTNPVNATIARGQGVGTIIDDDALILLTQENSQRAIALDSALQTMEPFPIRNDFNFFAPDHRTRVTLFAIGLKLAAGETASAVTATAEDSQGTIRPLDVEFVGKKPIYDWLTHVVVKLNDQITLTGDVKIKITLHSVTSNTVLVAVKPQ